MPAAGSWEVVVLCLECTPWCTTNIVCERWAERNGSAVPVSLYVLGALLNCSLTTEKRIYSAHATKMPATQRRSNFERQLDVIEQRIREKLDVNTGFADPEIKARKFEVMLRHYDTTGSGVLTYSEFFVALTKLNFVGVQREIEALFYRYDVNSSGLINYHEFAYGLFGLEGRVFLDKIASRALDKIRAAVLNSRGALGLSHFLRAVRAMDRHNTKELPRHEILATIHEYIGLQSTVSGTELTHLLNKLELSESGMVSSVEFLRGLLTGVSSERKQIIANLYKQFDGFESSQVSPMTILEKYDCSSHPNASRFRLGRDAIESQIALYFDNGFISPGFVTLVDFLDFYYGISLTIDDDEDFELSVRNCWHSDIGALVGAASRRINISSLGGGINTVELRDNLTSRVWDSKTINNKLRREGYETGPDLRLGSLGSLEFK